MLRQCVDALVSAGQVSRLSGRLAVSWRLNTSVREAFALDSKKYKARHSLFVHNLISETINLSMRMYVLRVAQVQLGLPEFPPPGLEPGSLG